MSAYVTASHDDIYVYVTFFGSEIQMSANEAKLMRDELANPTTRAALLADLDHGIRSVKP